MFQKLTEISENKKLSKFSTSFSGHPALKPIKAFAIGEMDIEEFMRLFTETNEIADYLDSIVDYMEKYDVPIRRRTILMKNVNQNKPFAARSYVERYIKLHAQSFRDLSNEWKVNPPKVSAHLKTLSPLTAHDAYVIHGTIADFYYQFDQTSERTEKYHNEFEFILDTLPGYLSGGVSAENYVSQFILPKYPTTMKKGERKRMVKEEIKIAFPRDCKGYPRWLQSPEWPMGSDGKPAAYVGQKAFADYTEYYFRDTATNAGLTVTQWW